MLVVLLFILNSTGCYASEPVRPAEKSEIKSSNKKLLPSFSIENVIDESGKKLKNLDSFFRVDSLSCFDIKKLDLFVFRGNTINIKFWGVADNGILKVKEIDIEPFQNSLDIHECIKKRFSGVTVEGLSGIKQISGSMTYNVRMPVW